MTIEKELLEAIEPLIDEVVNVNKRLDGLKLEKGEKGAPGVGIKTIKQELPEKFDIELDDGQVVSVDLPSGEDGEQGEPGENGAGIDSKMWQPGVYREGSIVQHNIGQYFKAIKDTAEDPNASADWERIGSSGFRFAKSYTPENVYSDGDLFVKDFGLFGMFNGEIKLLAGRGPKGERGERGVAIDGKDGMPGRDGAEIIAFEAKGFKAVLLMKHADGDIKHHTIDFEPILNEHFDAMRKEFGELAYDEVAEVVNETINKHDADDTAIPMHFYRGVWEMENSYKVGDSVIFNGKLFLAKAASSGVLPYGGSLLNPFQGSDAWEAIPLVASSASGSGGSSGGTGAPVGSTVYMQELAPVGVAPGSLWYNVANGALFVLYDDGTSVQWVEIVAPPGNAMIYTGDVPPDTARHGTLWLNSATGSMFSYYADGSSAQWIEIVSIGNGSAPVQALRDEVAELKAQVAQLTKLIKK